LVNTSKIGGGTDKPFFCRTAGGKNVTGGEALSKMSILLSKNYKFQMIYILRHRFCNFVEIK
jgi:hypothetical protein